MNQRSIAGLVIASLTIVLVAIVTGRIGGWWNFMQASDAPVSPAMVSAETIDPANEGRLVKVQGELESAEAPSDPDLGFECKDAAILQRRVEMYEWHESCIEGSCSQTLQWSEEHVDSRSFRENLGHENPGRFPFSSMRVDARGLHVGAFRTDPDLVAEQIGMVPRPVRLAELPANLAASFSEFEGQILAGTDPIRPAAGGLRISYQIVPAGMVALVGVQRGDRLVPMQPDSN